MPVTYKVNKQQHSITISVEGHFDFRLVTEFRKAYSAISNPDQVIINLEKTDYIDSSGLGILIYLRKYFNCTKGTIHLVNCNPDVTKTFVVARFNKMFTINEYELDD